jgi:ABC-type sugar transport system permease subunit
MREGRASILFDPGWMFLVAGLVLVVSSVLVPASYDLWVMRTQLRHLDAQERENFNRLEAYGRFVQSLDSNDPQLVRRLAAAQLNLVPSGETPLIRQSTANRTPTEWVDMTVAPVRASVVPFPDSLLSRLTLGRKALWVAGAGVMCMFLGLLSAPLRMGLPRPRVQPLYDVRERTAMFIGLRAPRVAFAGMSGEAETLPSVTSARRAGGDVSDMPSVAGAD